MSIAEFSVPGARTEGVPAMDVPAVPPPLHRLGEVRRRQCVSRRTMARRLNTDVDTIKREERETHDMPLSRLYQWQAALDVPIVELVSDAEEPLSAPVLRRAQMVRLMKTAMAILERSQQVSIRRMAQVLVEQLVEIMPELAEVSPWHSVGRRRSQNEIGQAAQRRIMSEFLHDYDHLVD
jgi:transcriptional regulator with XRE-family HTH domain